MSRLLTLLLLYRAGFIVGKYISIEMLIAKTKDSCYEALQESSQDWHENGNNYIPFLKYMLGVVVKAYNEFEDRVEYLRCRKVSKPERIKTTIERTLAELMAACFIYKIGSGISTAYVKNELFLY